MNFEEIKKSIHARALERDSGVFPRFFRWLDRATSDYRSLQAGAMFVAAGATGLVAVSYAQAFRNVEGLYSLALDASPIWTAAACPFFFLAAWWLVHRVGPEASGSGIPQVMAVIEVEEVTRSLSLADRLLSLKTGLVKILSSLLCLAGGGAIGREGPTIQLSGIVFHFFGKQVRRFYPKADEQTWIIAGAAAGLASAFNTPLGGVVYAIEELGMKHFQKVRTALLTSVIISGLTAQAFLGSYLYLGYPRLRAVSLPQWGLVILIGFAGGLLGAFFSRGLLYGLRWRRTLRSTPRLALVAMACGAGAGALIYFVPASHGPGGAVIENILFEGGSASYSLLAVRILGTAFAYLSGAAGGIFAPSLAIGACLGSKLSYLFGAENLNLFAMLGMISVLTGVTHTPFTSFILVMEMSDRHSAVFPMMAAALLAHSAAKAVDAKSFYEGVRDLVYLPRPEEPSAERS